MLCSPGQHVVIFCEDATHDTLLGREMLLGKAGREFGACLDLSLILCASDLVRRCFARALELDCSNSKLWIEYGSLAYQLHSFASRQLKQVRTHPGTHPLNYSTTRTYHPHEHTT